MNRILILLVLIGIAVMAFPTSASAQGYVRRPRQTCMKPSPYAPDHVWYEYQRCLSRGGNVDFYDPYDDNGYGGYGNYPYYDDYGNPSRPSRPMGHKERLVTYGLGGALIGGGLGGKKGALIGAGAGVVVGVLENRSEDRRARRAEEQSSVYQAQQYPNQDQQAQNKCLIINRSGYNIEVVLGGAKLALPNGSTVLQNKHSSSPKIPMEYWDKLTALVHTPAGIVPMAFERKGNELTIEKLKL